MTEFIVSGLRSGIRGRSVQIVFVLGLALVAVAYLAAGFSPRHPRTVALDIGFSGARFTLILLSLFWVQDLVTREIDRKIILQSLSYPVSRAAFLFGRYLAVLGLVCLSACILALCLLLAVVLSSPNYDQEFSVGLGLPYWAAFAGIVLDVGVVAAVAMAVATVSTVAVLPLLVGAAFAVAGKALGPAFDYLARGADGDVQFAGEWGGRVEVVRWLIPDLSRLDWRDWPLYGAVPPTELIVWPILMALAYALIVLALAWRVLERREFG
ncbi:MAG: hypothetical protein FD157_98 [Rhodocyclaceae bacterium]|nr:MAG: hypothetical protein FD157_98 [Rhodocyclaceae bacterium]TND04916.1 MAG: hypothetical protein FD118_735 [Rhodocyclaceae bacterium]